MAGKLEASDWIWRDGEFLKWEDTTVHLLSLAVQFGISQLKEYAVTIHLRDHAFSAWTLTSKDLLTPVRSIAWCQTTL